MERTLVLIKPDAVERNLIGRILSFYEKGNLKIVALKMEEITKELAEAHYYEHKDKDYYYELIEFIKRSPLCALVLEGYNAIERTREINGATNPEKQKEGTIRKSFALSTRENCVHASDSKENAKREINLWFPELK